MKRVLFINAKRKKCNATDNPHLGLAMLSAVLKHAGYEILVIDYQFRCHAGAIEVFIDEFRPDVIGITLYTATMKEAGQIINAVSRFKLPIIAGGVHATLYSDDLLQNNKIDYIVKGEAENIICQLVDEAEKQDSPRIIESKPADLLKLPPPDFTSFFEHKEIIHYPWLASRGCPYNCIFCPVHSISSKVWRPRLPEACVEELVQAKQKLPKLNAVGIFDDSLPNRQCFKDLLTLYIERKIDLPLTVVNTRADIIDEEILSLLKRCRCPSINLGAEHGDPDIFNRLHKGETLEDIKKAAKLIKKYNIALYFCFIIGLPGDSVKKTKYSIKLAKELKADSVIWNLLIPYKGTEIRGYFESQPGAEIFSEINHSSWVDADFMCDDPCVQTKDFTVEERKKAYLMAILNTGHPALDWDSIPRLLVYTAKYCLYIQFFIWLYHRIMASRLGYPLRFLLGKKESSN